MKIMDFVKEMKAKAISELLEVSNGGKCIEQNHTFKVGKAHIAMIRGGAIEKASITELHISGVKPPGLDTVVDGVVYQMEVFPENPYCPMGHFNTEWTMADSDTYHMNLDLFPAVKIEEDLAYMRSQMDTVADKFKRDRNGMREGLDQHYNMEHWQFSLATKAGCKLLKLKEADLPLFMAAYQTFFNAYLEILKKRKATAYSHDEEKLKLRRNGKWLEYLSLKDGAFKMAQAYGMPGEMLISLGYPPSAVF